VSDLVQAEPETSVECYRLTFEEMETRSKEPAWMRELRRTAMGTFERLDFPTMKDEDWHFTNVAPIAEKVFAPSRAGRDVPVDVITRFGFGQDWITVVFVNGRMMSGESQAKLPDGLTVVNLAAEIAADSQLIQRHLGKLATSTSGAFTALNTALATDGAVIVVTANTVIDKPIHLLFITDSNAENTAVQTRNLVFAEKHSQCTVIESYASVGGDNYFTNAVTEVFVADGARVGHREPGVGRPGGRGVPRTRPGDAGRRRRRRGKSDPRP